LKEGVFPLIRKLSPVFVAVLVLGALALETGTATATHPSDGSRDPMVVAQAMALDPATVIAAELATDGTEVSDHSAVMQYANPIASFPTAGDDFAMVSNGETNKADDPNNASGTSTGLFGLNTNRGQDLAGLNVEFAIPPGSKPVCFQVDVKFLSEEFPEFVGSPYNDFATGRINNTTPPSVTDGDLPDAPGNFLHDETNVALTVNNNYLVSPARAAGSTYDGATPVLVARADVPDGTSFTFSAYVADVADSIYDTTLFLDNAEVFRSDKCREGTFGPSVTKVLVTKGNGRFKVNGTVAPVHDGDKMSVTLFKKTSGGFKKIDSTTPTLKDDTSDPEVSRFDTSFTDPKGSGVCKVVAAFARDGDHLPSSDSKTFKC
jgi:hypothetical protein